MELRGAGARFGGPIAVETPDYRGLDAEAVAFSIDTDWMPSVVLARQVHLRLAGAARRRAPAGRSATLRDVPDEALDRLAGLGVTGLWLIGLWQRSAASAEIKRRRGDADAVASAYAIDEYQIADDLGGEPAFEELRGRAWARGIRLAADMVPNHMGIDSRWVVEHPERFVAVPEPPFPAYSFNGPDLSADPRVEITLEDHYWDNTDAAVVFRRRDRRVRGAALHLPRQRRHVVPVERHGPARLPAGRRSRGGHPDDPRRRPPVVDHPVRRGDGAHAAPRPAAVVPGARLAAARSPREPSTRCRARSSTAGCRSSSGARSSIGSPPRRPGRSSSRRRSGCSRATSCGRSACIASTTRRSCTCSATRTTPATTRSCATRSSSTRASSGGS